MLRAEFKRAGALHDRVLRYVQAMLLQISQVAACNRLHQIEERLARWLLMSSDRARTAELPLTHEFIALMLWIRRAGVTDVAGELQRAGLIRYMRGHLSIVDREGLEECACECYRVIRAEFERLPGVTS